MLNPPPAPTRRAGARLLRRMRAAADARSGATAIEYGLIAAILAGVIVAALPGVGTALEGLFATISAKLTAVSF